MKNIAILLVCNAGMSTSLLIEKIEKAAIIQHIDATVSAHPVDDIKSRIAENDVILLGPQVRFKQKQIKEQAGDIPVAVIDMAAYGTMNGEQVLQQAIQLLAN